jgi:hypothetical protein
LWGGVLFISFFFFFSFSFSPSTLLLLQAACETPDRELARVIVESAGVRLPRGQLTECYDERGHLYNIPEHCIT